MANSDNDPPLSPSQEFSRTESIGLLLHGSCPRCHHWFNRHPIQVFRHTTRTQMICCNNCRERFFGLGGNSTHNSFNSQLTIPQSPKRESSSRRPRVRRSTGITTRLEAVNEVATLGIFRTRSVGGAGTRLFLPGSHHPLRQAHYHVSSPTALSNPEGAETGDHTDMRLTSHRLGPLRPVVQAAKDRVKRTVNKIRYRPPTVPPPTWVDNQEPEHHQPLPNHGNVHTTSSNPESRSAEPSSTEALSDPTQNPHQGDDGGGGGGGQEREDPTTGGTCRCGVDCCCAAMSSNIVGSLSSAGSDRLREFISPNEIGPHSQDANVGRQRWARRSALLAHSGAWAHINGSHQEVGRGTDSRRSSTIEASSSSSGDTPTHCIGDHRYHHHPCQVCCRRLEAICQRLEASLSNA